MSKAQSLQDPYLNALRQEQVPITIYLVNGVKMQGKIESFDQFCILIKNTSIQLVYKHAISTIIPSRPVCYYNMETKEIRFDDPSHGMDLSSDPDHGQKKDVPGETAEEHTDR